MKRSTKFLYISSLLVSILGGATVFASTWTVGNCYVPAKGGGGITAQSNQKTSNDNLASFNGDAIPNAYGYTVRLVNSAGEIRSGNVGLYPDKTTYGKNNSGLKGYYYYAEVFSKKVEPHGSTVKLHFSADTK
ncbi:hypothetical protein IGI37_002197 [Enterococcus sp. AZ194]|uniref:choline-binding protein n=1 Tax=Enterococcus sp. AZ194 TaxID=2774629 RepID=UPI003F204AB5